MNRKKTILILIGVIVIGMGVSVGLFFQEYTVIVAPRGQEPMPIITPLLNEENKEMKIEERVIEIIAGKDGFSPSSFRVKANERINLKVRFLERETGHIFGFEYPGLGLMGAVEPDDDINAFFYAPAVLGEYEFYSRVVNANREEIIGKMIVE